MFKEEILVGSETVKLQEYMPVTGVRLPRPFLIIVTFGGHKRTASSVQIFQISVSLVCLQPVGAPSCIGNEGDGERGGTLHFLYNEALELVALFGKDAEVQFVVHL